MKRNYEHSPLEGKLSPEVFLDHRFKYVRDKWLDVNLDEIVNRKDIDRSVIDLYKSLDVNLDEIINRKDIDRSVIDLYKSVYDLMSEKI